MVLLLYAIILCLAAYIYIYIYSLCFSDFGTSIPTSFNILMICFYTFQCLMLTTGEFSGVSTQSSVVTPLGSISSFIFSSSNSTDDSGPTSNFGFSISSIAY